MRQTEAVSNLKTFPSQQKQSQEKSPETPTNLFGGVVDDQKKCFLYVSASLVGEDDDDDPPSVTVLKTQSHVHLRHGHDSYDFGTNRFKALPSSASSTTAAAGQHRGVDTETSCQPSHGLSMSGDDVGIAIRALEHPQEGVELAGVVSGTELFGATDSVADPS